MADSTISLYSSVQRFTWRQVNLFARILVTLRTERIFFAELEPVAELTSPLNFGAGCDLLFEGTILFVEIEDLHLQVEDMIKNLADRVP